MEKNRVANPNPIPPARAMQGREAPAAWFAKAGFDPNA